ncbi:hypothetical protein HOY80DRAFT_1102828 [Tuber brumale]|nr:hypothetical protein HOY80DRAFT_1102828 [Tuber brumale]
MDADMFLTGGIPELDGGQQCDRKVIDVGWGRAGVLVWRSVIEVEEEVRRDDLSERTAKPILGPDGKTLAVPRARSRLRAVVATGPIALIKKNIYLKSDHQVPGAPTEKNKAPPTKLYRLMIAISRLPQIRSSNAREGPATGFRGHHLRLVPILRHYINDVDEAFQSLLTCNAYGATHPAIEKGPGAIIAACTGYEPWPMLLAGTTDGPRRRFYCHFSQCIESHSYHQRLLEEPSGHHQDWEY